MVPCAAQQQPPPTLFPLTKVIDLSLNIRCSTEQRVLNYCQQPALVRSNSSRSELYRHFMSLVKLKKNFLFVLLRTFVSGAMMRNWNISTQYQPLFGAKGFLCYPLRMSFNFTLNHDLQQAPSAFNTPLGEKAFPCTQIHDSRLQKLLHKWD